MANQLSNLQGTRKGQHCLLIAGGPSGMDWAKIKADVSPDFLMVINGAIQNVPNPDYFVYLDYDEPRPVWSEIARAADYRNTVKIVAKPLATVYEDGIATRTSTDEPEVRSSRLGLKMYPAVEPGTRLTGTTSLCALHLAGILGCSHVTSIGVDLCFDNGQHWYPCRKYGEHPTMSGGEMEPKAFEINGRRVVSCYWFVNSASAMLRYKPELTAAGLHWEDRSGGLLGILDADNTTI